MKLQIINTGSAGNCYILSNCTTTLMLECGVHMKEIKQALDFDLSKVSGCLVTHEHKDHCKSLQEVTMAGIEVYASAGTIAACGIKSHRLNPVEAGTKYQIGEFTIMPFDVQHDCAQPFGYLIHHADCGNVLFLTDSFYCKHTFKGLNNILVEANYSREVLARKFLANEIHGALKDRVIKSHMSLETCKELLSANDLSKVNNIVLIHLSDSNSDAREFKKQVSELTGKTVTVAEKNMTLNFSKTPF